MLISRRSERPLDHCLTWINWAGCSILSSIPELSHFFVAPPPLTRCGANYSTGECAPKWPGYPARWSYQCLLFRDYFYKGTPSDPNSMILFPGCKKVLKSSSLSLFLSRKRYSKSDYLDFYSTLMSLPLALDPTRKPWAEICKKFQLHFFHARVFFWLRVLWSSIYKHSKSF